MSSPESFILMSFDDPVALPLPSDRDGASSRPITVTFVSRMCTRLPPLSFDESLQNNCRRREGESTSLSCFDAIHSQAYYFNSLDS